MSFQRRAPGRGEIRRGRKDARLRERKERGRKGCVVVYVWCGRAWIRARASLPSRSLRVASKGRGKKRKKKNRNRREENDDSAVVTTVVALCVVAIVAVLHSWVVAWQGLRQFRCDSCGMAHSIRCSLK